MFYDARLVDLPYAILRVSTVSGGDIGGVGLVRLAFVSAYDRRWRNYEIRVL
jgi:hypothetical protein